MKKLIFFGVLVIVFASCKKSSSGTPVNSITATINDTNYTFNNHVVDTTILSDSSPAVILSAADYNLNTFTISFGAKNKPLIAGTTYGSYGDSIKVLDAGFFPFYSPSYNYIAPPYPKVSSNAQLTVTLTSISSTNIQGTFKGTIFLNGDTASTNRKTVTNGRFNFTKALTVE
jgi:hypothetical protein